MNGEISIAQIMDMSTVNVHSLLHNVLWLLIVNKSGKLPMLPWLIMIPISLMLLIQLIWLIKKI